jgi:tetratricopeptide (TPR) repeat protein
VRIGVSLGEVERTDDDDYYGLPVVEAARLCATADGGQILTTELVRTLVGARGGHAFSSLGSRELKGLREPVAVAEVGWAPATGAQTIGVPVPDRLKLAPRAELVGRTEEFERLEQLFKEVEGHERRLVLVGGEAGIGKTALLARFASIAHTSGAAVLYGRCDEELGIPYQPWGEALRHLVEHAPEALLADHVATYGGEIARLVPELRRKLSDVPEPNESDGELLRYEFFGAVLGLLRETAANAPVVVLLDDLHWADKQTLLLLRHVVEHITSDRLFIAGTYRDVELTETHPLTDALAVLRREPGVERIALRGLNDRDLVTLVEVTAGNELDEEGVSFAHALHRETDGNPYFTLEVLRHLVESRVLVQGTDGRWSASVDLADISLPQSVREVIGQRVRRLGDVTYGALSLAAVIGRDFDLDVLAAVSDHSEDELLDLLEPAIAAGVVIEQADGFSFFHTLIQHSLYDALGATRRRRAHLHVAQALEQLCGDDPGARVGELARHWMAATAPVDAGKAIEYARQAGCRALDSLAPDDATSWFVSAIDLLDRQPDESLTLRCDLLIGLGTAQRQGGNPAHHETLLEAVRIARDLRDGDRLARAALANNPGRFAVTGRVDPELLRSLEVAIELLPDDDSTVRAELLSTLAAELTWSDAWERRRALAEDAVAMARRLGDPATLVRVIARASHAIWVAHTHELRREWALEALAVTEGSRDAGLRGLALVRAMSVLMEEGGVERFDLLLGEQQQLADRLGEPLHRFDAALLRTSRVFITASLSEAQEAVDALLETAKQTRVQDYEATWGALAGVVALRRGELEEFLPLIESAMQTFPDMPSVGAALASLYCELGRDDDARALLDEAAARGFSEVPRDKTWNVTIALWSDTAADLGATEHAQALYDALRPFDYQVLMPIYGSVEGPISYHLGRLASALGCYDESVAYFLAAEEFCRRIGATYWLARNQLAHARMREARHDSDDLEQARQLFDETRTISSREGYRHLERQAAAT